MPRSGRQQGRASATLTVMTWTFLGKLAGLVRNSLLGAFFGAGVLQDAIQAALAVPLAINSVVNVGLSTVTVPFFHEDPQDAPGLNTALTRFVVWAHVPLVLALGIFAPDYLPYMFRSLTPHGAHLASQLVWLFAIMLIPLDLTALWTARLNAVRRFTPLSAANLVRSLSNVIVLVLLRRLGIISTGAAYMAGAVLSLLYMFPSTRPFPPPTKETWRRAWHAIRLLPTQMTSSVVGQINFLVDKAFAASLATGGLATLTFAGQFLELPVSLFGSSLATVLFPDFAQHAQDKDAKGLIRAVDRALYLTWVATLPIALLLIGFAVPLTSVVYGYGRFRHAAIIATAAIVAAYAISLVFRTMQLFVARAFFSYKNTRTLAYVSAAFIVLNAVLDYVLMHLIGAPGIALGTTIDGALYFLISLYLLEHMLVGRHTIAVRPYLWTLLAAVPIAPLGLLLSQLGFVHGRLMDFVLVIVGGAALLGLFLVLLRLLGGPRGRDALNLLARVLRAPNRRIAALRR